MSKNRVEQVYLIGSPELPTAKIGCSGDLPYRLYSIQLMSPVRLEVLWSCEGGRDLERALHARFALYRSHGEWFTFPQDPVQEVQEAATTLMSALGRSSESVSGDPHVRAVHWNQTMPLVVTTAVALYLKVRRAYGDNPFTYEDAAVASRHTRSEVTGQIRRLREMGLVDPADSVPGIRRGSRRQRFVARRLPPGTCLGHRRGVSQDDLDPDDLAYAFDHKPR